MKEILERYLNERSEFQEAYDALLRFGSEGVLEKEILAAKDLFFSKLGRAHEMREDLYESASQTFLEWYLFQYETKIFGKSPVVVFLTLNLGTPGQREILQRSLSYRWSLFEVKKIESDWIVLDDLLFMQERRVLLDLEAPEVKVWKIEEGQIIQARLFPLQESGLYFFSHLWLHPSTETEVIRNLCKHRRELWSKHQDLLLSAFEAVIRTLGLQTQLSASRSGNWLYLDLKKRYA